DRPVSNAAEEIKAKVASAHWRGGINAHAYRLLFSKRLLDAGLFAIAGIFEEAEHDWKTPYRGLGTLWVDCLRLSRCTR
ncbi:hypothetical protein RBJ75_29435, partial (plasmid) [Rhodopseudomonas sp. BAL398]|uniref:hypothetical protein n=1 Tax=Rhodopseudomonas sp. BAL398 TaxID=3034676 RepID=UPI00294AFA2B